MNTTADMPLPNRLIERPLRISYTAWRRWSDCPMQERLLREGAPRADKPRRDFLVGNVVHDMLEELEEKRVVPLDLEVLRTFAHEAQKPGVHWRNANDRSELQAKALDAVRSLAPWALNLMVASEDVEVEMELGLPIYLARGREEPYFLMTAKMDLVVCYDETKYAVIDYKTGGHDVRQIHWQAAVWSMAYPEAPDVAFYVVTPEPGGAPPKVKKVEVQNADKAASVQRAREVCAALHDLELPADPDVWKCGRCRVRISCPAHPKPRRGRTIVPSPSKESASS